MVGRSKVFGDLPKKMARYSGILCHLTSLPNGLADAERFIDLITFWRLGLANATDYSPDDHGSPYASPSAFATYWEGLESKIFDMKRWKHFG